MRIIEPYRMRQAFDYLQRARMLMADAAEQDQDDPDPIGICLAIDNVGENLENMITGNNNDR